MNVTSSRMPYRTTAEILRVGLIALYGKTVAQPFRSQAQLLGGSQNHA